LFLAAKGGHASCLRVLARRGTDMRAERADGVTASILFLLATGQLFRFKAAARVTMLRLMVNNDGRHDVSDDGSPKSPSCPSKVCKRNAWFSAVKRGGLEILEEIADNGFDLDTRDSLRGMTAAMWAARLGRTSCLKTLAARSADLNAKDTFTRQSAISHAAEKDQVECLQLLIQEGTDLDAKDHCGETALMKAAFQGNTRSVKVLAAASCDLDAREDEGLTAAFIAAQSGYRLCVQLLAEHGANLLQRDRHGKMRNALHQIERTADLSSAISLVPSIDWHAATNNGLASLLEVLQQTYSPGHDSTCHVAVLHLLMWRVDLDGLTLAVRDRIFVARLIEALKYFLGECKEMTLEGWGKHGLTMLLEAYILRALDRTHRSMIKRLNNEVLEELEFRLIDRQEEMGRLKDITTGPDEIMMRWSHNGTKIADKLDQRDALPRQLWEWLIELPECPFQRISVAFQAFKAAGLARTTFEFANYLWDHQLDTDHALFAKAAAHMMVGYGQDVDKHFAVFMQENFGKKFKHAPIKKLKRIFNKMKSDAPALENDRSSATDSKLRCAYFVLGDIVRGSIRTDGASEMCSVIERLKKLTRDGGVGRFQVWRIKNTHHPDAEGMTGGYRDVKVLGRFHGASDTTTRGNLPVSMIVEIQVIDSIYMDVKNYMHKAYAIDRGDYD